MYILSKHTCTVSTGVLDGINSPECHVMAVKLICLGPHKSILGMVPTLHVDINYVVSV